MNTQNDKADSTLTHDNQQSSTITLTAIDHKILSIQAQLYRLIVTVSQAQSEIARLEQELSMQTYSQAGPSTQT